MSYRGKKPRGEPGQPCVPGNVALQNGQGCRRRQRDVLAGTSGPGAGTLLRAGRQLLLETNAAVLEVLLEGRLCSGPSKRSV